MSQTAHKFDPSILREYDIRGIVGGTVHAADARAIGRTLGTLVRRKGGKRVALGYDGRLSSPELAAACIEGLTAAGIDVVDIGLAATPMLYFAVYHLEADGGIQITGSHNPPDYNGFKMMMGKKSFFGADIQMLGAMAGKGDWETGPGQGREALDSRRLCGAPAARREARQEAQGCLGYRQRRRRCVDPRRR
jgi:phosphomannomutase